MRKFLILCAAMLFGMTIISEAAVGGKVLNKVGQPIVNATVELLSQGLKATSGADGAFSIPTTGTVAPFYVPQTEKVLMNRGVLEINLTNSSPVKVAVFDLKGNLLKNESMANAQAGVYRFNAAENLHATNMLFIHAVIGSRTTIFRYLPFNNSNFSMNGSIISSIPIGGRLAKITVVSDSLKASATGYTTKTVKISSYDTTVTIILDSAGACPHAVLQGNNILFIGDSWIQMPGTQVTHLLEKMIAAGSMASGAKADRREVSGSTLAQIVSQFSSKSNANAKILIMDGGGIDLFSTPLNPTSSQVTNVVNAFKSFLQKVKDDGHVEHIIYSLYPKIPSTMNVNGNMKPGFTEACQNSPVDCHLVDLEPLFNGQHFASDRTHADESGAKIIADAWWKCMQENCIGQ